MVSVGTSGSLTPPGAPAPTMKTLDQMEPSTPIQSLPAGMTCVHRVTVSGAYHLTGNITGFSGGDGILVSANNVSIDLRGFTISGVSSTWKGINASGQSGVSVRNGFVTGWDGRGIELGTDGHARDLHVTVCGGEGIYAGARSVVEDCTVNDTCRTLGDGGIYTGSNSRILNCTATNNRPVTSGGGRGIYAGSHSVVRGNVCSENSAVDSGSGIGIEAEAGCEITDNLCRGNSGAGSNSGTGIMCTGSGGGHIARNTCIGNRSGSSGGALAYGIRCDQPGAEITDNTCRDNSSVSGSTGSAYGVYCSGACSLIARNNCSANVAQDAGLAASAGIIVLTGAEQTRIEDNQCASHAGGIMNYGILVWAQGGCVIRGNNTSGNATTGIRIANTTGKNYCAENMMHEGAATLAGTNVAGTGDRADVPFN